MSIKSRVCAVVLLSLAKPAGLAGPVTIIPVALSGDDAPGLVDTQLASFSDVRLNNAGDLVFWSELEGPNVEPTNDGAILRVRTGDSSILLLEGEPAPWYTLPADFVAVPGPRLADDGTVAFVGAVSERGIIDLGDEARNIGAFRIDLANQVRPLLRKGEQAPGLADAILLRNPSEIAMSNLGASALRASTWDAFENPQVNTIYSDRSGSVQLLARTGDVISHMGQDLTLDHLDPPTTNTNAHVTFRSALNNDRFPERDYAIVSDATGALAVVLATGDPAPGVPDATFEVLDASPNINSSADLALQATLAGVDITTDASIWRVDAGLPTLIAREGDAAPGTTGAFAMFNASPQINDATDVAFWATASLPDESAATGIWADQGNGLQPIAIEGDAVFGLKGVQFAHPQTPHLDNRGRILFLSTLQGQVTTDNDRALFVRDEVGRLEILLREGDEIDATGNGDLRTVAEIIFDSGPAGGRATNGARQAGVVLRFQDDSLGVFIVNATAPADIEGDADIDAEDFFAFLDAFAGRDPIADFDQDGDRDAEDLFAFLDAFLIM